MLQGSARPLFVAILEEFVPSDPIMPWYSRTIRPMTPAELKRDKERLDAFLEPFERSYAIKHPSPDELARQRAEAEAKKILNGWDRLVGESNPEWGI